MTSRKNNIAYRLYTPVGRLTPARSRFGGRRRTSGWMGGAAFRTRKFQVRPRLRKARKRYVILKYDGGGTTIGPIHTIVHTLILSRCCRCTVATRPRRVRPSSQSLGPSLSSRRPSDAVYNITLHRARDTTARSSAVHAPPPVHCVLKIFIFQKKTIRRQAFSADVHGIPTGPVFHLGS